MDGVAKRVLSEQKDSGVGDRGDRAATRMQSNFGDLCIFAAESKFRCMFWNQGHPLDLEFE